MRTQLSKSRPSLAGQRVRIQKLARETKARNRAKGLVPRIIKAMVEWAWAFHDYVPRHWQCCSDSACGSAVRVRAENHWQGRPSNLYNYRSLRNLDELVWCVRG